MPVVLRVAGAAEDAAALEIVVQAGASEVETEGADLLGLFVEAGGEDLPARLAGLLGERPHHLEPARLVDHGSVWAAALREVQVGGLRFVPAGLPASPGAIVLDVDGAFGSAGHPTTRLCLSWLAARPTAGRVLDVGTGNGVLAIAAARLGAARVDAFDLDPTALEVARRNLARAGLQDRVQLGPPGAALYDRVVANLLAAPVISLASDFAAWLAPQGELAVSGFSPSLRGQVTRALQRAGLRVFGGDEAQGWCRVDALAPW